MMGNGGGQPAVAKMKPKALFALVLLAGFGGPAWAQDEQNAAEPDAQYAAPDPTSGDDSATEPSDSGPDQGETPPHIAPRAGPYANSRAANPYDQDLNEMYRRNRAFDPAADNGFLKPPGGFNPLNPPREVASNPYDLDPLGDGASSSGGARPRPPALNSDLSEALGFNHDDLDAMLAPMGPSSRGESIPGSDTLDRIGPNLPSSQDSAIGRIGPDLP